MNDLKTNVNLSLLYEVRKHALTQSRDAVFADGLFSVIHGMMGLASIANKEGLLALEEAAQSFSSDGCFYADLQTAVSEVCDGTGAENLIEMLTSRYWIRNLQGENALIYYLIILSAVRIQDGISEWQLEQLLTACLSEKNIAAYEACKIQKKDKENKPDELELLLGCEPDIGEGGISIVKELLEEKIEQADIKILKKVIRSAAKSDLEISLKGLSILAKRKLLSAISKQEAEEYARDCEYMGPVRQRDITAAMAELVHLLERTKLIKTLVEKL